MQFHAVSQTRKTTDQSVVYSTVPINVVKGCVNSHYVNATFYHVYWENRILVRFTCC